MTPKAHNSRISVNRKFVLATAIALVAALGCFVSLGSAAVRVAQSGWSWGSPTPQGNTLGSIDFVQGRGYAAGAAGTVLRSDDQGANWTGLATGTSADLARQHGGGHRVHGSRYGLRIRVPAEQPADRDLHDDRRRHVLEARRQGRAGHGQARLLPRRDQRLRSRPEHAAHDERRRDDVDG